MLQTQQFTLFTVYTHEIPADLQKCILVALCTWALTIPILRKQFWFGACIHVSILTRCTAVLPLVGTCSSNTRAVACLRPWQRITMFCNALNLQTTWVQQVFGICNTLAPKLPFTCLTHGLCRSHWQFGVSHWQQTWPPGPLRTGQSGFNPVRIVPVSASVFFFLNLGLVFFARVV